MKPKLLTKRSRCQKIAIAIFAQAAALHARDCEMRNITLYAQTLEKLAEMSQVAADHYVIAYERMQIL